MKKIYVLTALIFCCALIANAQVATDYFPTAPGFKWLYKNVPYDTLGQQVDSLAFISIDTFAVNQIYEGKPSKIILGKSGPMGTILQQPYLDTSIVALDSANIWNYLKTLPGLDSLNIGGFLSGVAGWYNTYMLSRAVNSSYTLFTRDTNITYNGITAKITFEVKAKRVADQTISTPIGNFVCKKFIMTPAVKATVVIIIPITIPIVTVNDTVYIAPGNYVVRDVRPTAKVDLSYFGQLSFYVNGNNKEIQRQPAVLSVSRENILINYTAGDSSFTVINTGADTLHWKANVVAGSSWLHLTETSGTGNKTIHFSFTANPDTSLRIGMISVSDTNAWGSPKLITITQKKNVTSVEDNNIKPVQYYLSQNFPNPFNPETVIRYSVPVAGNVSIKVYNLLGAEIAALVDGYKSAGNYSVIFSSKEFGNNLSSGVYFYTIRAGQFTQTRKMVIMK